MGSRIAVTVAFITWLLSAASASAQWSDPKLIAGQVGFHVAVSFLGKLIHREPPGRALKAALAEGAFAGGVAHAGYCLTGTHPQWALAGKALAQKSYLTTRRSVEGLPVFDRTLATHWEITHSFVHFEWTGEPRVEIDAVNAAFSSYYLLKGEPYHFDVKHTLLSGSLVFQNSDAPEPLLGYYVPGVLWVDASRVDERRIWSHELVHSLQAERGTSIKDWRYGPLRFNWLVFASGVPALLAGWPEHDTRLHEREAEAYAHPEK